MSVSILLVQWFPTGVDMDPRGPCNTPGGPQVKYNKFGAKNDILMTSYFRTEFNGKQKISIVIYTILKQAENIYE